MTVVAPDVVRPSRILSLPPLAGLAVVMLYLGIEWLRPGTLTAAQPETVSEAVVVGNGPMALEMMARGLDVNAAGRVRARMWGPDELRLTPLEAALLSQRIEIVRLLLRTGAEVSRSPGARCLALQRLPEALPLLGVSASEVAASDSSGCPPPPGR